MVLEIPISCALCRTHLGHLNGFIGMEFADVRVQKERPQPLMRQLARKLADGIRIRLAFFGILRREILRHSQTVDDGRQEKQLTKHSVKSNIYNPPLCLQTFRTPAAAFCTPLNYILFYCFFGNSSVFPSKEPSSLLTVPYHSN